MSVEDKAVRMSAGMVSHVPSNIFHSAKAITDCKVINIFYPAREDFEVEKINSLICNL